MCILHPVVFNAIRNLAIEQHVLGWNIELGKYVHNVGTTIMYLYQEFQVCEDAWKGLWGGWEFATSALENNCLGGS